MLGLPTTALADVTRRYTTMVVDVIDGDSIVGSSPFFPEQSKEPVRMVKLDGVDAPEPDQPSGKEARQFLLELLKGKEVTVIDYTDRGKSRGAWLFLDGKSVNVEMVRKGLAWPVAPTVPEYQRPKEAGQMAAALAEAKAGKLGIWKEENPTPPWEWKKSHEGAAVPRSTNAAVKVWYEVTYTVRPDGSKVQKIESIPWSKDLTLRLAVASAGGFSTPPVRHVHLVRNGERIKMDQMAIERGQIPDPLMQAGDVIELRATPAKTSSSIRQQ